MDPQMQRYLMLAIFGIVAGTIAGLIVGYPRGGLIGAMVAGLLGSVVGSFLFDLFKIKLSLGSQLVDNLVQASIGAAVVIVLARILL